MFSSYTTDVIRVIETRYDDNGVESEVESDDIGARIEDVNRVVRDIDGKELFPQMLVMFDYSVTIKPTWKIKIRKKHKVVYYAPDKKWELLKFEQNGMFKKTHVEAYL